jgi:hypothetical protein
MCDYSLCGIPNRLAVERENLVVYRFPTGSMGLASPADLNLLTQAPGRSIWSQLKQAILRNSPAQRSLARGVAAIFSGAWGAAPALCGLLGDPQRTVVPAVCIPPGAYLMLSNIPEDLRRQWRVESNEGVVFVQTSANVNSYRDAIQFHDGRLIRLQDLREGQQLEVLSLAGAFMAVEEGLLALL